MRARQTSTGTKIRSPSHAPAHYISDSSDEPSFSVSRGNNSVQSQTHLLCIRFFQFKHHIPQTTVIAEPVHFLLTEWTDLFEWLPTLHTDRQARRYEFDRHCGLDFRSRVEQLEFRLADGWHEQVGAADEHLGFLDCMRINAEVFEFDMACACLGPGLVRHHFLGQICDMGLDTRDLLAIRSVALPLFMIPEKPVATVS